MIVIHPCELERAKTILDQGKILAVPTETVYGLAVKFDHQSAITKLLNLKDRQAKADTKKLTLMLHSLIDIPKYIALTPVAKQIIITHFPGELTVVLPKNPSFKNPYFDNLSNIGIRIPNHPFMLDLLKNAGPLLVTSANRRGQPPCLDSDELISHMPAIDALVLGHSGNRPPSTVLDLTGPTPKILRQGCLVVPGPK